MRPLTAFDVRQLQQVQSLLGAGRPAEAVAISAAILARGIGHADALALHGIACRRTGRLDEARAALAQATALAPANAALWNSYANLLDDLGEGEAALAAYRRAVAIMPAYAEAWTNLGVTAAALGRHDEARAALAEATRLDPGSAHAWGARGHGAQQAGDPDAAVPLLEQALALDPGLASARHNLAAALRAADRPVEALAELDRLAAQGAAAPETLASRAHVLAELGRFDEAVDQYRTLLGRHPAVLDAQETLARLLPQLGRPAEALDGYQQALAAVPDDRALWLSAIHAARDLQRPDAMLRWSREAQHRFGAAPDLIVNEAHALGTGGDAPGALALLEPLATDDATAATFAASWSLRIHDPARAERHALRATMLAPQAQPAWAYLTLIWRLLEDPREVWLADYERLVLPIDLPLGHDDLLTLERTLSALHVTRAHPAEQSLRQGTQTRGKLFDKRAPAIRALCAAIRQAAEARLRDLTVDAGHPFLARNTGRIAFAGSWSVRLVDRGFHIGHIHHQGWLSSALYIALPPGLGEPDPGTDLPQGALTFGVPEAGFGLDLAPRRIELPRPGRLVLFPSYFWHGTVPFAASAPRLTVAFDALPA